MLEGAWEADQLTTTPTTLTGLKISILDMLNLIFKVNR
jgi:hypothetical protein